MPPCCTARPRPGTGPTVLSINSMMAFLAFGVAGPLLGLLADRVSLPVAMVTAGARHSGGVLLPARPTSRAGP